MFISTTVTLLMAYPPYLPPPYVSPTHVSFHDRQQQKVGLFKLTELRAVLKHAGLNCTGNKSRVLQSVRNLITQDNQLAIEKINIVYNQVYGDNVRVPTSTIQERKVPPSHPPVSYSQAADRPPTSPSFQFRRYVARAGGAYGSRYSNCCATFLITISFVHRWNFSRTTFICCRRAWYHTHLALSKP